MANNRRGGLISLTIGGVRRDAKGNFSYNLGARKREAVVGADAVHGYKSSPQVPMIEGAISDSSDLDLRELLELTDVTVVLQLENGKSIALSNAWFAGEGAVTVEEGEIAVRFEGLNCREV